MQKRGLFEASFSRKLRRAISLSPQLGALEKTCRSCQPHLITRKSPSSDENVLCALGNL